MSGNCNRAGHIDLTNMTHPRLQILAAACLLLSAAPSAEYAQTSREGGAGCNRSLWNHVYNPSRLKVVTECVVATGVITEIEPDDDGDSHMLLRLDPGQEK